MINKDDPPPLPLDHRDPIVAIQFELKRLRRSSVRLRRALLGLSAAFLALAVIVAAIAGLQGTKISSLDDRQGLISNPNVAFASRTGRKNLNGLTYGGSLFRGSGFWAMKPRLPYNLADHAAIGVDPDELIFIIGGSLVDGNVTSDVWKYDTVFRNYTKVAPMPEPRYRFGAALLDKKIYVVGGRNSSSPENIALVKSTLIYDIAKNEWSRGTDQIDFHGDTCAASVNGKIYVAGGYGFDYNFLNSVEVYDPAKNQWSKVPNMPTPRGDLMCVSFMNELYVLGGYYDPTNKGGNAFLAAMESFNPTTGQWTKRPDMLTPRGDAAALVLPGNKLMIVGGEGHYREKDIFKYPKHVNEVFYGDDQTWVQKAMIPTPRFRTAGAVAGGVAFVFGGADVCIAVDICPVQNTTETFLDVDHPRVYLYLKNEAYNDNSESTTYPV
ncbi:hypothetical protein SELMODRAFT_413878 [Selaginella moellendorffii]|uniref:Attractin/MKLN-like beta-propeller domain-containing protein n=2 Tax=Selaginella moellendorffii TaxID=88036 RepID=D8RQX4_SELML|nr:hypothetical protein SELMODRAFT_413878 [Selaginella moellendorffii]